MRMADGVLDAPLRAAKETAVIGSLLMWYGIVFVVGLAVGVFGGGGYLAWALRSETRKYSMRTWKKTHKERT